MVPPRSTSAPDDGTFDSDGLRIHFRAWHPSATPRAVVVIVPGFNAHSAYYAWAAEQLVADRFAVYALDLRGRGLSDGERFYVDTFDDYVADVTRFVALAKSQEPAVPIFLLGHSAGGVVASLFTIDHQADLAGLICESFAYQVPAPDFALPVLILHGTADKATKPSGSQFFYDTVGSSDKTLKFYDGGFHDPLNDIGKEVVMGDITAWIAARVAVGQGA